MSEQLTTAFIRALRGASGYIRLYGPDHPLCTEAIDETAHTATSLIGSKAGVLLGIVDDTFFLEGEACGLISLQYNNFLRDITAAGIETILMTPPVDCEDVGALVRLISGNVNEFTDGRTIRINTTVLGTEGSDNTSTARLRRSYTHSLDALRGVGRSLEAGESFTLDDTAAVVLPPAARPRLALVHDGSGADPFLVRLLEEADPATLKVMSLAAFEREDEADIDARRLFDVVIFARVQPGRLPGAPTLTIGHARRQSNRLG